MKAKASSKPYPKKELFDFESNSSMPLRHIGVIVIWEGNYNPDIKSIGRDLLIS